MREVDKKFAHLLPLKELYKAYTIKDDLFRHYCAFGHFIEKDEPCRILYFREAGWKWKGQEILIICAKHYKEITGKEL